MGSSIAAPGLALLNGARTALCSNRKRRRVRLRLACRCAAHRERRAAPAEAGATCTRTPAPCFPTFYAGCVTQGQRLSAGKAGRHVALRCSLGGPLRLRCGWKSSARARAHVRLADPQALCHRRVLQCRRPYCCRSEPCELTPAGVLASNAWPRAGGAAPALRAAAPQGRTALQATGRRQTTAPLPAVSLLAPLAPPARSALRTHAVRLGGALRARVRQWRVCDDSLSAGRRAETPNFIWVAASRRSGARLRAVRSCTCGCLSGRPVRERWAEAHMSGSELPDDSGALELGNSGGNDPACQALRAAAPQPRRFCDAPSLLQGACSAAARARARIRRCRARICSRQALDVCCRCSLLAARFRRGIRAAPRAARASSCVLLRRRRQNGMRKQHEAAKWFSLCCAASGRVSRRRAVHPRFGAQQVRALRGIAAHQGAGAWSHWIRCVRRALSGLAPFGGENPARLCIRLTARRHRPAAPVSATGTFATQRAPEHVGGRPRCALHRRLLVAKRASSGPAQALPRLASAATAAGNGCLEMHTALYSHRRACAAPELRLPEWCGAPPRTAYLCDRGRR